MSELANPQKLLHNKYKWFYIVSLAINLRHLQAKHTDTFSQRNKATTTGAKVK